MDAISQKVYQMLGLMNSKGDIAYRTCDRITKIDGIDGKIDGVITEKNAWDYLSRNESNTNKEIIAEMLVNRLNQRFFLTGADSDREKINAVSKLGDLGLKNKIPLLIEYSKNNRMGSYLVLAEIIKSLHKIGGGDAEKYILNLPLSSNINGHEIKEAIHVMSEMGKGANHKTAKERLQYIVNHKANFTGFSDELRNLASKALVKLEKSR